LTKASTERRVVLLIEVEDGGFMTYRLQHIFKIKNALAFDQAVQLLERLQAISRDQGFQERGTMTQAFGPINQLLVNIDYPDLASYERESQMFFTLPEVREVVDQLTVLLREGDPGESTMWEDV
jgi:hypothetical protein